MLQYKKPFLHSLGAVVNLSKIIKEEAPGSQDLSKIESDITALQNASDEHTQNIEALFAQDGILNDAIDGLDTRMTSAENSLVNVGSSIANHEGRIVSLEGTPPGSTSVNGATGAVVLVGEQGIEISPDGQEIFIRLTHAIYHEIQQLRTDLTHLRHRVKKCEDDIKHLQQNHKNLKDVVDAYIE